MGPSVKRRPPNREIDFGFVRAVRAGEAKLRGRAKGNSPVAGPRPDQMFLLRANGAPGTGRRRDFLFGVPAVSRGCSPGAGRRQIEMQIDMQIEMQIEMQIDNANRNANRNENRK